MKDFFISYNEADEAWAEWVAWVLEENGYQVVFQKWDFRPGQTWLREMNEAVLRTRKTIAILSGNSLDARFPWHEWAAALARERRGETRLIPIRVEECDLGVLASINYIDIVGRSRPDAVAAILGGLKDRNKPDDAPPFPAKEFPGHATGGNEVEKIKETTADGPPPAAPAAEAAGRSGLARDLAALSPSQFNMLVFALEPPAGLIPAMPAPQAARAEALVAWASAPGGPGVKALRGGLEGLAAAGDEVAREAAAAGEHGPAAALTCDRVEQEKSFRRWFSKAAAARPNQAQVFALHGAEREGHASLVRRFFETVLRDHAAERWKEQGAVLDLWEVERTPQTDPATDLLRLPSQLLESRGRYDLFGDCREAAAALRSLFRPESANSLIVVEHELKVERWGSVSPAQFRQYLEFWDEVATGGAAGPQFVVFLNVLYPDTMFEYPEVEDEEEARLLPFWERARRRLCIWQARRRLRAVGRLDGRNPVLTPARPCASFAVLDELTCVKLGDLKEWFRRRKYGSMLKDWETLSQRLYLKQQWGFSSCRNMADVEAALEEFLEEVADEYLKNSGRKRAYT